MGVDLETYRRSRQMTWRQLQEQIGASSESQARRWALGMEWPRDPERIEHICAATGGEVDVYAMHRRRVRWVRINRRSIQDAGDADTSESAEHAVP
jgi:hypothetical protein